MKLAVGVITEDSAIRFVGGPIDSVKAKTTFWTAVSPGNEIGKQMLKHVLTSIAKKASERMQEAIANASIEEIRDFIPFGTANVLTNGRLS